MERPVLWCSDFPPGLNPAIVLQSQAESVSFFSARTKKRIFCQGQNQYLGKIKILTAGIHEVFRGLKFLVDADIGKKGLFRSGTKV
jgi:hypothetical protein